MKKKHYILFLIIVLITSGAAYRFGIEISKGAWSESIASVQAMHSFNRLLRYEELSKCLKNGKFDAVDEKVRNSIISEKELIAEYLHSHSDAWTIEYMSIRYPRGLEVLKNYKSNRGGRWVEPSCK